MRNFQFVSLGTREAGDTDLSDGRLVVRQTQQENPSLVDLHRNGPSSPLHLAHRGCLLCSCLSDQGLRLKK